MESLLPILFLAAASHTDRTELKGILESEYQVVLARDGAELLALLSKPHRPALVMLDLGLIHPDGLTLLTQMRQHPRWCRIPVVILAGEKETEKIAKALQENALEVVTRPFSPELIRLRLSRMLCLKQMAGQHAEHAAYLKHPDARAANRVEHNPECRQQLMDRMHRLFAGHTGIRFRLVIFTINQMREMIHFVPTEMENQLRQRLLGNLRRLVGRTGIVGQPDFRAFAICLPADFLTPEQILPLIEKALAAIAGPYRLTPTMGIVEIDDNTLSPEILCDRGWNALNAALTAKQQQKTWSPALQLDCVNMADRTWQWTQAIKLSALEVRYQPIFSLADGKLYSARANLCCRTMDGQLLTADNEVWQHLRDDLQFRAFSVLLTKVLESMENWPTRECQAQQTQQEQQAQLTLSLPPSLWFRSDLPHEIANIWKNHSVDKEKIGLRLENAYFSMAPEQITQTAKQLHAAGHLLIFGDYDGNTKPSTFSGLPLYGITVSQQLTMTPSRQCANLLSGIIRMVKWNNQLVTAEGLTPPVKDSFFADIGFDFFAPPPQTKLLDEQELICLWPDQTQVLSYRPSQDMTGISPASLWIEIEKAGSLFPGQLGAVAVYECSKDTLIPVQVNQMYFVLTGETPSSLFGSRKNVMDQIYPEDMKKLRTQLEQVDDNRPHQLLLRRKHSVRDDSFRWMRIIFRILEQHGSTKTVLTSMMDITDLLKANESQALMRFAGALSGLFPRICLLDHTNSHVTLLGEDTAPLPPMPLFITEENLALYAGQYLHPSDKRLFMGAYSQGDLTEQFDDHTQKNHRLVLRIRDTGGDYQNTEHLLVRFHAPDGHIMVLALIRTVTQQQAPPPAYPQPADFTPNLSKSIQASYQAPSPAGEHGGLYDPMDAMLRRLEMKYQSHTTAPDSILVVDDSPISRSILADMLDKRYGVLEASNGQEALDLIGNTNNHIVLILLDLNMPVMDGYSFLSQRIANPLWRDIPVLVISADQNQRTRELALRFGADDVLCKPYDPVTLRQRISAQILQYQLNTDRRNAAALLARIPGGVMMLALTQAEVLVTYISPALEEISGFTTKEYMAMFGANALYAVYEKDREQMKKQFCTCRDNLTPLDMRYRSIRKDGVVGWCRIQANFARMDGENPLYYALITDLDELYQAQATLDYYQLPRPKKNTV